MTDEHTVGRTKRQLYALPSGCIKIFLNFIFPNISHFWKNLEYFTGPLLPLGIPATSISRQNLYTDDIYIHYNPDREAQSVGHLTRKSEVLGSIPGLATFYRFSFRFFKQGSCQLLAKVCARRLPRKSVVRLTDRGR